LFWISLLNLYIIIKKGIFLTLEQIEEQKKLISEMNLSGIDAYRTKISMSGLCMEVKQMLYTECDNRISKLSIDDAMIDYGEMDDVFS